MGFYDRHVLPHLINCACGMSAIREQRARVVPLARGTVLEVGIGTGLNLPFYDPARVTRVIGLDPSDTSWKLAARRAGALRFPVQHLALSGEDIPLPAASVDTVLVTYSLCTIPDVARALAGMRRVLRADGQLVFCEHGAAPEPAVRRWQRRLDPWWGRVFGGCHLTRAMPELIRAAGFHIARLDTGYLPAAPRFAGYNYWGTAAPLPAGA